MYKHFNIYEREKLLALLNKGYSLRKIAKCLNRNVSSISRELKRGDEEYSPTSSQRSSYTKRKVKNIVQSKRYKNEWVIQYIGDKIANDKWSPEQIAGRLYLEKGFNISFKTIYNWIDKGVFENITYYKSYTFKRLLRRKGKKSKISKTPKDILKIENHIKDRPKYINNRERIGDFEADTVLGKQGKSCLVTLVDRRSRYLQIRKIDAKKSNLVEEAILDIIKNNVVHTITPDRGTEFAKYKNIEEKTGVTFYFTEGGSPWQKGSNENTNGLIREFIPKGKDISEYTKDYIAEIEKAINNRPRKCLGWKSAEEVYLQEKKNCKYKCCT